MKITYLAFDKDGKYIGEKEKDAELWDWIPIGFFTFFVWGGLIFLFLMEHLGYIP